MAKTTGGRATAGRRPKSMPVLRTSAEDQKSETKNTRVASNSSSSKQVTKTRPGKVGSSYSVTDEKRSVPTLPREVIKTIVSFALTSHNGRFDFPCLTSSMFRPEVNLSCLVLDRDLYHTARQALLTKNTFIFSAYGSDIKEISDCVGLYSCRSHDCLQGSLAVLRSAVFEIGDSFNPERSCYRIMAFSNALKGLRRPLQIEHLTIELKHYAWRSNPQLVAFCANLGQLKVSKKLTIKGIDPHLELCLRELPKTLGLDLLPTRKEIMFRRAGWQNMGKFVTEYLSMEKGKVRGEDVDISDPEALDDCIRTYHEWLKTAPQSCVVNGLDYVSEFGYARYR